MNNTAKQVHTVHHTGGWGNLAAGKSKVAKLYPTKAEAVAAGRESAAKQKAEHVIHKLDGTIGESNSYGNDPHPPKG